MSSANATKGDKLQNYFERTARKGLKKAIKNKAPKGPTGNLRKSVVVRRGRLKPTVIVAVDRKVAPHAHLVEFGTNGNRGHGKKRKKKALKFTIDGQTVFADDVGPMPANPFFRPAVDSTRGQTIEDMKQDIWKALNEDFKRQFG